MNEYNHNLNDEVESNSIGALSPEEAKQIENIFNAQDISVDTPPDSNLEQVFFSGVLNTFLLTREETNGKYTVIDSLIPPDNGPITHIHNDENEFFKVLDGTVVVQDEDKIITAEPGDIIFIPAGRLHAFRNTGDQPARMLTIITPDDFGTAYGGLEQAFREGGEPVEDPLLPPPEVNQNKISTALIGNNIDIFPEARLLGKIPLEDADNTFYGDESNEMIIGSYGSDIILGRNGRDELSGLLSHDTLIGGNSEDLLDGGEGDDLLASRESHDILSGGLGKDTLTGGQGHDILSGDLGDDVLNGDEGHDILSGGLGKDTLTGGQGHDILSGGLGDDVFTFELGIGTDYITDFQNAEDTIMLPEEITFEQLTITQGTKDNINETLIYLHNNSDDLIILNEIDANLITSDDFQIVV